MKWNDLGRSSNIEDRRGMGGGRLGMGIGGTAVLLVLSLLFGRNLFDEVPATTTTTTGELAPADSAREEPEVRFVSFVLDDAQQTWANVLPKYGTFTHSGFGLGLERTVAWICGIQHVREVIAFPRLMHRLTP